MAGYLDWAIDAADRLDQLEEDRKQVQEVLWGHTDTNRILTQWGVLVDELGVLRNRDDLRLRLRRMLNGGSALIQVVHILTVRSMFWHFVMMSLIAHR
jgi:hypothetical protein